MGNKLGQKFNFKSLVNFAMPNVLMMLSLSFYVIVDGLFIARIGGTTALSSQNMIYPIICITMSIAIMLATGGSAIVGKLLGEKNIKKAQNIFTFLVVIELTIGIFFALLGLFCTDWLIRAMQVTPLQYADSYVYLRTWLFFAPAFFLELAFQTFFVVAGKPRLGLVVILIAGCLNIMLDYLFMVVFHLHMLGAAMGTGFGYCVPAICGIYYFMKKSEHTICFTKFTWDWNILRNACFNGSSEMISNLANGVAAFLFNYMFLKFYGEDGVAGITIVLYFQYIFTAIYFGYANGVAPIISYKFGENNVIQLKSVVKNSLIFIAMFTLISNTAVYIFLNEMVGLFAEEETHVYNLTIGGFRAFSIAFWLMGFTIFISAMFTALSDGKTSGIISFSRTFLFVAMGIILFPFLIGAKGLWIAVPVAEGLGILIAGWYWYKVSFD